MQEQDVADLIAGHFQTSRARAYELMEKALLERGYAHDKTDTQPAAPPAPVGPCGNCGRSVYMGRAFFHGSSVYCTTEGCILAAYILQAKYFRTRCDLRPNVR